jgi:hypothetical protein
VAESISRAGALVPVRVLNQTMFVPPRTAAVLDIATAVATKLAKKDEAIVFLPHWPGLYPATSRLSPLKQTYLIRPSTPAEETEIIEALETKAVQWILLQDERLDNRDDLRFRKTNPLTLAYFREHFDIVAVGAGLNAQDGVISTYSDFRGTIEGFLSSGEKTSGGRRPSSGGPADANDEGASGEIHAIAGLAHDTLLLRRRAPSATSRAPASSR